MNDSVDELRTRWHQFPKKAVLERLAKRTTVEEWIVKDLATGSQTNRINGQWDARGLEFQQHVFRNFDFCDCCISFSRFIDCSLHNVSLSNATADDCDFSKSVFPGSEDNPEILPSLIQLRANRSCFVDAKMVNVSFACADLREASFQNALLTGAVFDHADCTRAVFRGANLRNARFLGADLSGADFADAELEGTVFD